MSIINVSSIKCDACGRPMPDIVDRNRLSPNELEKASGLISPSIRNVCTVCYDKILVICGANLYLSTKLLLKGVVLTDDQRRFVLTMAFKHSGLATTSTVIDLFLDATQITDPIEQRRFIQRKLIPLQSKKK